MENNSTKNAKGSIIILNTLIFMMISVSIVVGISRPITNNFSLSKSYIEKEQILMSMSSLANEVLYKIRIFDDLITSQELALNNKIVRAEIESINTSGLPLQDILDSIIDGGRGNSGGNSGSGNSSGGNQNNNIPPGLPTAIDQTSDGNFKKITISSEEISDSITITIEKDTETEEWNVVSWIQN